MTQAERVSVGGEAMGERITASDEALIEFYFREQYRFARSTSAAMFERAERIGVDSEGHRLKASTATWNWSPPARGEDGRLEAHGTDQELELSETTEPGGYELDHTELVRFARASRRLMAVERLSPRAGAALEAYHGERGSRWAVYSQERQDPQSGRRVIGTGPGSIAALYALTVEGVKFIASERGKATGAHLTDDEVLANAFAVQAAQPDGKRRARLERVRDAAESLLRSAWGVWIKTAPERRERRAA
jgi:hypothetical protein